MTGRHRAAATPRQAADSGVTSAGVTSRQATGADVTSRQVAGAESGTAGQAAGVGPPRQAAGGNRGMPRQQAAGGDATPRLQAVLAAEHAAIFGYGALGPFLGNGARARAATAEAAHRELRDAVATQLVAADVEPVPAARAYTLPFPVTSNASALKLAVQLEERTAAAWRAAVPEVTGAAREAAVKALTDCAVRATRWRRLHTPDAPATVPFPGV